MFDEKDGAKKSFFSDLKFWEVLKILFLGIFLIFIFFLASYSFNLEDSPKTSCNDGVEFDSCSFIQPFYCEGGELIEKASVCGCGESSTQKIDSCINQYQTNPKNITLKYTLRGQEFELNYTVYGGLMDYLSSFPKTIVYNEGEIPSIQEFKMKTIEEKQQRALILPLIVKIMEITPDKDDQFRIAVSMVQNIPFGFSNRTLNLGFNFKTNYQRYPYEVLYENEGICGEKSELLALLLKEFGYGTSLFYYADENHESVGVRCPSEEGVQDTGYCFIETTGSAIITNDEIEYAGGLTLDSTPEVIVLSKGISLNANMYEYSDAEILIDINNKIKEKGRINPLELYRLNKLKEKYQLEEYYDPR